MCYQIPSDPSTTNGSQLLGETQVAADKVLRHIVLFGFKDGTGPDEISRIVAAFGALQQTIPQIKAFEWGTNVSPENLHRGLTHAFVATFHSTAHRDTYLHHPSHVAFAEFVGPFIDNVTVVDYWTAP